MNDLPEPGPRPAGYRPWRRWLLALAGLLAVGLAVVVWKGGLGKKAAPGGPTPFPLPALSDSPFLNTKQDTRYVGSEACRSCHSGRNDSYRATGMGRSMGEVAPAQEPPDAEFDHPPSKRRYQVRHKDGKLWHRELLLAPEAGPEEVLLAEYPVRYVVGSGRHSRTYLAEAEGFLVESPVTWYSSRKAWGMSPGYDNPQQQGFERPAGEGCLVCHAGQAEAVGGSLHRMHIGEAALGCERCHGPGSLHVQRHKGAPAGAGLASGVDYTIVNPSHLSRDLAEAVCQQCHLRASATVVTRGRKLSDYRPGLPLQEFRQDYRLEVADEQMTVVGHVEQMHLSRCYQKSDSLTCLTCHDPHGEATRKDDYNSLCQGCHRPEHCKVDPARRQKESPANSCVQCHMPQAPTEIPHLAFTHHRIGIHDKPAAGSPTPGRQARGVLRPFLDLSALPDIDQKRSLGLGYLEVANRQGDPARAAGYREQALELLSAVSKAGLPDPVVDASLARLRFDMELPDVAKYAQSALASPALDGQERCNALFLFADELAQQGRHREALEPLRQLTQLRRHSVDWLLLGDCERAVGNPPGEALEAAVRINPRLVRVQQHLADHYRQEGNLQRAAWHQRRAVP